MQVSSAASRRDTTIYDPDMVMRARPSSDDKLRASMQASASAAAAERQVLARENALRARVPGAATHTTYTYATGPDGRRYITGADIQIIGTEDEVLSATGRGGSPAGYSESYGPATGASDGGAPRGSMPRGASNASPLNRDPRVQRQIAELQQREREVIAHEAAHMAAGGELAGGASYTYTTGPDGKKYITGGSVPISLPATSDPEEALRNAQRMLAAATAPSSPSGPDMAVAASAAQIAAQARVDLATQDAGASADGTATVGGDDPDGSFDTFRGSQAKSAYSQTASPNGLWTKSGVEKLTPRDVLEGKTDDGRDPFEIAA